MRSRVLLLGAALLASTAAVFLLLQSPGGTEGPRDEGHLDGSIPFQAATPALTPAAAVVVAKRATRKPGPVPPRPPPEPPLPKTEIRMGQGSVASTCGQRAPNVAMLALIQAAMDEDRAADLSPEGEMSRMARQVQLHLPGDERPTVIMTSVNSGFWPLTLNFLCSWERVPTLDAQNILFFTADQSSARQLRERGLVVALAKDAPETSEDTPFGTLEYLYLNIYRTQVVRQLLALGYNVFQVDLDQAWLADPFPLISTYLKPGVDIVAQQEGEGHPCGGLMLLRGTKAMRKSWDEILVWLEETFVAYAQADCIEKRSVGDQLGLLRKVMKKKLKLALLPHDLFSPGFVFFDGDTKRLENASRPRPMVVHNNWIVGQAKKIARFKDYGLWFVGADNATCTTGGGK